LEAYSLRLQEIARLPSADQSARFAQERLELKQVQSGPVAQTSMNAGDIDLF
jgi:hypothetical protein